MGVHKKKMYGTAISSSSVTDVLNKPETNEIVGLGLTKGVYDSQSQIKTPYSKIVDAVGIRSDLIVAGNSILGVNGTASSGSGLMDTSDGNITADDVIKGKIGYNSAGKVVGNLMDNRYITTESKLTKNPSMPLYLSWNPVYTSVISPKTIIKFPFSHISNLVGLTEDKLKEGCEILGVLGTVKPFETQTIQLFNTENDVEATSTSFGGDCVDMRRKDNKFYVFDRTTVTETVRINHKTINQSRFIMRSIGFYIDGTYAEYKICFEVVKKTILKITIASNMFVKIWVEPSGDSFLISAWTDDVNIETFNLTYEVM